MILFFRSNVFTFKVLFLKTFHAFEEREQNIKRNNLKLSILSAFYDLCCNLSQIKWQSLASPLFPQFEGRH